MPNMSLEEEDALQTKEALESLALIALSLRRIADVMEKTRSDAKLIAEQLGLNLGDR